MISLCLLLLLLAAVVAVAAVGGTAYNSNSIKNILRYYIELQNKRCKNVQRVCFYFKGKILE